uniref:Uncharacterized protein n=1 Tax=Caenorhabditis japonica TaxID=281687 RepID=A0A8R1EKM5_CAEJA
MTLVVQITVPTFTIFMPVMIMFAIPFLDMSINIPTGPILCALSLYPFIDAIIVLCIISDYRKASLEQGQYHTPMATVKKLGQAVDRGKSFDHYSHDSNHNTLSIDSIID